MLYHQIGAAGIIERANLCGKLCWVSTIFALTLCGIVFVADVIFEWSGLQIFSLALFPLCFALIFAVMALIRSALFSKLLQEAEEKQILERRKETVGSILDVAEDVRFSAKRTLSNFDKYIPAVIAVCGFLLGAVMLYLLNRGPELIQEGEAAAELMQVNLPVNPVNLAFMSVVCAAFSFFCGIFLTGQSNVREYRWLKPVGSMFIFGGLTLFLAALSALLYIYGKTGVEPYLSRAIFYAECLLTIEMLANFIMDFYRPRTQEELRPVYESRLLSLFTEPGGVVRNIASSLDYQFGFKVSKTSVYVFVGRVFIPALMLWVFLLWAFTAVAEVGPGELGIRERFGKAVGTDLEPGVHAKLPWPFERIIRVPVDALQNVTVGLAPEKEKSRKSARVILWNKDHYITEDPFLVAAKTGNAATQEISHSVAILETTLPIYYRAKRTAIRDYAYQFSNIPATLLALGKAEATAYFASADFETTLSSGREQVCRDLKARIQKQCDALQMGIEIVSVNMMDAHPPIGNEGNPKEDIPATNVAEAYQQVVIAGEEVKTMFSAAKIDEAKLKADTAIAVFRVTSDAEVYKVRTTKLAEAEKNLYLQQLKAFRVAPDMFKLRLYLDFIVEDCKDRRKFVVSKDLLSRIYEFNFEEKVKLDLLEAEDLAESAESK